MLLDRAAASEIASLDGTSATKASSGDPSAIGSPDGFCEMPARPRMWQSCVPPHPLAPSPRVRRGAGSRLSPEVNAISEPSGETEFAQAPSRSFRGGPPRMESVQMLYPLSSPRFARRLIPSGNQPATAQAGLPGAIFPLVRHQTENQVVA